MQNFVRMMLLGVVLLCVSACDQIMSDLRGGATPEVTPLVENESLSGDYFLTLSGVTDEFLPENTPDAPTGSKWIVVNATITNVSGPTVVVGETSLYLIDDAQTRYLAETPDEAVMPPLVGATIASGEGVRGLARFAVPPDVTITQLLWCMDTVCEKPLSIDIPDF